MEKSRNLDTFQPLPPKRKHQLMQFMWTLAFTSKNNSTMHTVLYFRGHSNWNIWQCKCMSNYWVYACPDLFYNSSIVFASKIWYRAQSIQIARLSLQSSELAHSAPSHGSECCSPSHLWFQGGTHSLAGEGAGEPIRTKRQTLWYSRYSIIPLRYRGPQRDVRLFWTDQ
jgi:hypothetical protein